MGIAQVLLCIAASCAIGEASPDEPTSLPVDFYLSAMLAEREKLRSGEFVVSGTRAGSDPAISPLPFSGRILIYCAFDDNRIRMDNLEPGIVVGFPPTNPPKMWAGRIERMFFRTPQQSVTWNSTDGKNRLEIARPGSAMRGRFLFFDVRGLGLTTWQQLSDRSGVKVGAAVATLNKSQREKSVDTSDPKYVQLAFLAQTGGHSDELRYWLRPDQGFAPVRMESRMRTLQTLDPSWQVYERAEISWEQIDGVWLPVNFEIKVNRRQVAEQKLACKVRWPSVNKRVDDTRFDWQDFGAPDTVTVVDTRGAKTVVIRRSPELERARAAAMED